MHLVEARLFIAFAALHMPGWLTHKLPADPLLSLSYMTITVREFEMLTTTSSILMEPPGSYGKLYPLDHPLA